MPHIKLILLQIQVMELLQHSITETINELGKNMNQSTIDKLLIANHSLGIEIMMSHARVRVLKNPNYEDQQKS